MKRILNLITVAILATGCAENKITPSDSGGTRLPVGGSFFFGKTSGPDTFAPKPYNLYKISRGKLFGAFVPHINPDSVGLYPMTELSSEKYQEVANLPSLLPGQIYSESETRIGLINIDSGYDFIKVSMEAGTTRFFYIGDGGIPEYLTPFKQALDQDLGKLSN